MAGVPAPMHVPSIPMLVLFDVDGTLTATGAVDGEVYANCFEAVFGTALPTTNWAEYACPTDQGIADEAVRRLQLDPSRMTDFKQRFVADLRRELAVRGARPVPGATDILGRLATAGHAVALATGAWEQSARAKLAAAGVEIGERVLVGSDFDASREEILREARRRSGTTGCAVYVGDGLWDARAAEALDLPFVAVDHEGAGVLRLAGVRHVVRDYEDFGAFLRALRDAAAPTPSCFSPSR